MDLRFPKPLQPGDRVGITSPSAGVGQDAQARIDFSIQWLRDHGYEVVVGNCMSGQRWISGPKSERAAELMHMLTDSDIRAIIPPWGGAGTALDLLDQLDFQAIASAEPTWVIGYSDSSTWMVPLTLRAGLPTLHGDNLADTPYQAPPGLAHWSEFATSPTSTIRQEDSRITATWHPFTEPAATTWRDPQRSQWRLHGVDALTASGTLIGGCIEVMSAIAGTPYGDVHGFGAEHGDLIVYLEAAEEDAYAICRHLHQLRYSGWFSHATAILIGRTNAPNGDPQTGLTQQGAVLDALEDLGLPIVFDMEIGHVPPHLPLLNGAHATIEINETVHRITQTWK